MEQVLRFAQTPDAYFWSVHSGAELDLLLMHKGRRYGIEFKYSEAPKVSRSMHSAVELLHLDRLWVITPRRNSYPIREDIAVCGLQAFREWWSELP